MTRRASWTNVLFEITAGKTLREILEEHGYNTLYGKWKLGVFDKRNRIVHRGDTADIDEEKNAFETVFKIIVFLDPRILNDLRPFAEVHENLVIQGS